MPEAIRGNSLYKVVDGPSWAQAEANASALSGHLATIDSAEENAFVENIIFSAAIRTLEGGVAGWIGLNDNDADRIFSWSSNESSGYRNWDASNNQPNYAPQVVVGIISGDTRDRNSDSNGRPSGSWHDYSPEERARPVVGVAEIPLRLSTTLPTAPKEGAGAFTTSINLSAGNQTSGNLANGVTVYWRVTGITADDLSVGSLTGSGTITNGRLDIQHSLRADSDTGERFEVAIFSDSALTQQIGNTSTAQIQESDPSATRSYTTIEDKGTFSLLRDQDGAFYSKANGTAQITQIFDFGNVPLNLNNGWFGQEVWAVDRINGENAVAFKTSPNATDIHIWSCGNGWTKTGAYNLPIEEARRLFFPATATTQPESSFSIASTNVWEGSTASVTVTRTGATNTSIDLIVSTSNGTASSGTDYKATNQRLTFGIGEASKTILIETIQDTAKESNETFGVGISSESQATRFSSSSAVITIEDDDNATSNTTNANTNGNNNNVVTGTGNTVSNTTVINNISTTTNNNVTNNVTTTNNTTNNVTNNTTNNITNVITIIPVDLSRLIQALSPATDAVTGSASGDVLGAGKGSDRLTGGGGADQFVFKTPDAFGTKGADTITDFSPTEGDKIAISQEAFPNLTGSPSLTTAFSKKELAAAQRTGASFIYYQALGQLFYDQNGGAKGFGIGGLFAILANTPSLSTSNLGLIG